MAHDSNGSDTFVIRFYMTVSKRAHPDLARLLDGLSMREQNRRLQALLHVAAHAERCKLDGREDRLPQRAPDVKENAGGHVGGLIPGLEPGDIEQALADFGDFGCVHTNPTSKPPSTT